MQIWYAEKYMINLVLVTYPKLKALLRKDLFSHRELANLMETLWFSPGSMDRISYGIRNWKYNFIRLFKSGFERL